MASPWFPESGQRLAAQTLRKIVTRLARRVVLRLRNASILTPDSPKRIWFFPSDTERAREDKPSRQSARCWARRRLFF